MPPQPIVQPIQQEQVVQKPPPQQPALSHTLPQFIQTPPITSLGHLNPSALVKSKTPQIPPANFKPIVIPNLDARFGSFEAMFSQQFNLLNASLLRGMNDLRLEVSNLKVNREEMIARDKRLSEVVIERVVNKSMTELNSVISEGLKLFFENVKDEIDDLQNTVAQSTSRSNAASKEVASQMEAMTLKMDIFQKQLEKNEAQQQLLIFQFQQKQQHEQQFAALSQNSSYHMG
jgi:hypothetical protein